MPSTGNTTTDPESIDSPAVEDITAKQIPALTLLSCSNEPHRVGEVAFLDATGRSFLGRDASALDAITLVRVSQGGIEPTGALTGSILSKQQLAFNVDDEVEVVNTGRRALFVNGKETKRAKLAVGDVITIEHHSMFLFSLRPKVTSKIAYPAFAFGERDAFGIVGESAEIWALRQRLAFVAQFDEHALILGESGTGKELAARAIHAMSRRAGGAFVDRNVATIPYALVVPELYGNKKDYPNAGMPESPGLLGAANGGVLFLDEIAETPTEVQAALLRVFDPNASYQRLGDPKPRKADVRFIGATNREPGALKSDLVPRFTYRIEPPPLDACREDIPLLARALVLLAATNNPEAASRHVEMVGGRLEAKLDPSLVAHLVTRDYPGNVRDLDIVLHEAMAASSDGILRATPAMLTPPEPRAAKPARAKLPSEEEVRAALGRHDDNVTRAADDLQLNRFTLIRLIKKYGLRSATSCPAVRT